MKYGGAPAQCRWWTEEDPASKLFASVASLDAQGSWQKACILEAFQLYGDTPVGGMDPGSYAQMSFEGEQLSYNVVRSITDTTHAETVQSRPRPMFLTSGADWEMRQKAAQLTKFADGIFYQADGDEVTSAVAKDAILFGVGIAKIFDEDGDVRIERVLPGEVYVDARDAREGKPRSLYQVKHIDRSVLYALYPDSEEEIASATRDASWLTSSDTSEMESDLVVVVEAWHLPSGKKADDGRHVIAVQGGVLVDEGWEEQSFPFAFLRWSSPLIGFWTAGAGRQLAGIQYEINALVDTVREAQDALGSPYVLVEEGSNVVPGHITDQLGRIVKYRGTPPIVVAPTVVSRDTYEQIDRHYAKAYELFGVSQLAAQQQKPAGLDSGKALRTYADIQSKRFLAFGRAWEKFHMDIAKMTIRCARRIAADDPSYNVVYQDKTTTQRIRWEEVDLDEVDYVLKVFPTSSLGNTPAGKIATALDWFQAGAIDQKGFARLTDQPDLESAMDLDDASHEVIERLLTKMVTENRYISPEPFFDLADCVQTGVKAYSLAVKDDVPEDRLEHIRTWIEEATALQKSAAPPPPAPAVDMPPPGPPVGAPPMPLPPPGQIAA